MADEVQIELPASMRAAFDAITERDVEETNLALPEYYGTNAVFIGEAPEIVRRLFAFHRYNALIAQDVSRELSARRVAQVGMLTIDVVLRRLIPLLFKNIQGEGTLLPARGWKLYCAPVGQDPFGRVAGSRPN